MDESGIARAGGNSSMLVEVEEDPSETLIYVAAQTKEMARVEKDVWPHIEAMAPLPDRHCCHHSAHLLRYLPQALCVQDGQQLPQQRVYACPADGLRTRQIPGTDGT